MPAASTTTSPGSPRLTGRPCIGAVPGTWIPIEVAFAHYEVCESLGLPTERQIANGRAMFDKMRGIFLGTMVQMARESGVTPWTVCPLLQRFWERGYDGGGISVTKIGPKEARMELVQFRLGDSLYYRNALRGLLMGVLELFCQKAYVTELPRRRAPASVVVRAQWA